MWGSIQEWTDDSYPDDFHTKNIRAESALAIAHLPPVELAAYFRQHLDIAEVLLLESYDKRFSPSSFIKEDSSGFCVGWWSSRSGYQHTKRFTNLADAAIDYLLFSLGKGRWIPTETVESN